MADDGKPEHYAVKLNKRIEELEAENAALRKAAGTSLSVVGAPSPGNVSAMPDPTMFAAMFIAANEVRNMGGDSVLGLMQERWSAARQFNEWVRSGEDVKFYAERQAKIQAEAERLERIKREDEAGEKRKREAAAAARAAHAAAQPV